MSLEHVNAILRQAQQLSNIEDILQQLKAAEEMCQDITRGGVRQVSNAEAATDSTAKVNSSCHDTVLQRLKLQNKVALVTGAGQGLGRAFAHALGEAGASVAVVDLNLKTAETVRGELLSKGIRSIAVQADLSLKPNVNRMMDAVVAELGGLHIAVNNAGIVRNSAAEDTSEEEWDTVFAVNAKGVFLCCQAEAQHMLAQRYGKIINISSVVSTNFVPHPQKQAAYIAAKAAVAKLTQTLACEWIGRGVNVNCISPGITNTPLIQIPELQPLVSEWLTQIPAGRLAEVEDLQAAVVYLASDASSYLVGHNLVIDGGHSLW